VGAGVVVLNVCVCYELDYELDVVYTCIEEESMSEIVRLKDVKNGSR
jgi:hypothetical protein